MPNEASSTDPNLPPVYPGGQATYETLRTYITATLIPLKAGRMTPNWGKEEAMLDWWIPGVPYINPSRGDPWGGRSSDHEYLSTLKIHQNLRLQHSAGSPSMSSIVICAISTVISIAIPSVTISSFYTSSMYSVPSINSTSKFVK